MAEELANNSTHENTLKVYFDQIKKTGLLTFEEEIELSKRIQKGDESAKRKLIEANLRLVVRIAKAYITPEVSLMDLIQEGNLGLIKAASKYDYRKEVRFSTYASWWIKQSIVRSLSNKKRAIRLPHRKEEKIRKIGKIYNQLSQKLMRAPTSEEIAEEMNISEEEVEKLMNMSHSIVSLDSGVAGDTATLQDVIEDYSYDPDKTIMDKCLKEETQKFLENLLKKEKKILMYRFAFFGGKRYTLKYIGHELGISPETVRQIEMRALKKLKNFAQDLKEYIYN
ncbi:MAG: sigma-70 family RNA polymerase sigma factor [Spirochaetales bacterium]|nr:sigma-70 family RNA polymerase sigma factor [Spirochaetales bacterium]